MNDLDDIPPLEDMSKLIDQIKEKKKTSDPVLSNSLTNSCKSVNQSVVSPPSTKKQNDVGYGGMRKGFLFGNSKQKSSQKSKVTSTTKFDYELKPKESKNSNLVLNEVQEAVKENQDLFGNKEWVTDDLLKNIEGNENLLKKLSEPKFVEAVDRMQKDPKAAMELYKDQKDVQEFFMEFYKILGKHFTALGEQATSTRKVDSARKSSEELEFEKTISRPEIRDILAKPSIKNLLTVLKSRPEEGQHIFHSAGDEVKADVKKLVEAGLLNFEAPPNLNKSI